MKKEESEKLEKFDKFLSQELPEINTILEMMRHMTIYTDFYVSKVQAIYAVKDLDNKFDEILADSYRPDELK